MTRRLFFKIFLAFWIAMTVAGFILLRVEAIRATELAQRLRGVTGDAFAVYAASAIQDYQDDQQNQDTGLRDFLSDLEKRTSIRAWVFDGHGHEISGFAPQERRRQPLWLRERTAQLIKTALRNGTTEFTDLEGVTLAARAAPLAPGRSLILVGILPDSRYNFWGASTLVQLSRFLAIFVAAGLVSWILARHLIQPLEELGELTRRLADGDFTARATTRIHRRRDELADLAGDFNGMAARIESLLREQDRLLAAQRHLLADVAHELRSPLARSTVALELARDALDDLAEDRLETEELYLALESTVQVAPNLQAVRESLNRIERETGNLTDLIDRLLMLSRLESGVQKPEKTLIDLAAMVRAIAADADFEARSQDRQVQVSACVPTLTLGSNTLLRSAIENVARNAVRHTKADTIVEIGLQHERGLSAKDRWEQTGTHGGSYVSESTHTNRQDEADSTEQSWAVITIRDHGAGVPIEELSEIFRPFYRYGSGRARQKGGAGLGLTITARALELHGGQYRLRNAPDGGLEVQLRLTITE